MVLTLSGVLKDILLVGLSVVLFGTPVTFIQCVHFHSSVSRALRELIRLPLTQNGWILCSARWTSRLQNETRDCRWILVQTEKCSRTINLKSSTTISGGNGEGKGWKILRFWKERNRLRGRKGRGFYFLFCSHRLSFQYGIASFHSSFN